MKTIDIQHNTVAYTDAGEGDVTLLFVHGSFINSTYWDAQLDTFRVSYRVIALDLPGNGDSSTTESKISIQQYGEILTEFIKSLNLTNVILIGHSMGGDVCLETINSNPEPIIGLIGVDYFRNAGSAPPSSFKSQIDQIVAGLEKNYNNSIEQYVYGGLVTQMTPAGLTQRVIRDAEKMDHTLSIESIKDFLVYYKREKQLLRKLDLKLYLINSVHAPTNQEVLRDNVPSGFEMLTVHGTSHYPMTEVPAEFNDRLEMAIRKIELEQGITAVRS